MSVKILFDTNVIVDVLCNRPPWAGQAAELFSQADTGEIEGVLCATTVTTIDYLLSKKVGPEASQRQIARLLEVFTIANVDHRVLSSAVASGFSDYEDAVVHEVACRCGVDSIVTRDKTGFKKAKIPVDNPHELHVIEFPPA